MDQDINYEQVKRKLFKLNLISTPASLLIALSLYALFATNGDAFHPLLNDLELVYTMLGFGILLQVYVSIVAFPLLKLKAKMQPKD